jgi:hypothetical protein
MGQEQQIPFGGSGQALTGLSARFGMTSSKYWNEILNLPLGGQGRRYDPGNLLEELG